MGVKRQWDCRQRQFLAFSLGVSLETLEIRPTFLYSDPESLVGFSLMAKCMTLNDLDWLFHVKFCFRASTSSVGDRRRLQLLKTIAWKRIKVDSYCQQQKSSAESLVFGSIRFVRLFARVTCRWASNENLMFEMGFFAFPFGYLRYGLQLRLSIILCRLKTKCIADALFLSVAELLVFVVGRRTPVGDDIYWCDDHMLELLDWVVASGIHDLFDLLNGTPNSIMSGLFGGSMNEFSRLNY